MENIESHQNQSLECNYNLSGYVIQKKHCKACRNHGKNVLYKKHKNKCEFKNCECEPCQDLKKHRDLCRVRAYSNHELTPFHDLDHLKKSLLVDKNIYKPPFENYYQHCSLSSERSEKNTNFNKTLEPEVLISSEENNKMSFQSSSSSLEGNKDGNSSFRDLDVIQIKDDLSGIKSILKVVLDTVSTPAPALYLTSENKEIQEIGNQFLVEESANKEYIDGSKETFVHNNENQYNNFHMHSSYEVNSSYL